MITAIICSLAIGFLVGAILISCVSNSDYPFSLEDFERERRVRAENEATKLYIELENMRRDQIRLASYPMYSWRNNLTFEIQKLPRCESQMEAEEKYGEHYGITDAIIGKLNEVISEVNNPTIKRI